MAETTGNARVFQEMQSADALRQELRQAVADRFRQSVQTARENHMMPHEVMYDSNLAHGLAGGLRDAYRRIFEAGWYGKDVFDGRWHMDNQVGQSGGRDGGGIHGMDRQYDQRASFYGWDQSREDGRQAPAMQPDPMEKAREMDQGIGR